MIQQYAHPALGHLSYMIASPRDRVAVVVDPTRDVDLYLEDARTLGVRIRQVFLTEGMADFTSGQEALRHRTGATIHAPCSGKGGGCLPMIEGDSLRVGDLVFRFWETPRSTVRAVCITFGTVRVGRVEPVGVLTGRTLLDGDAGRPPLSGAPGSKSKSSPGGIHRFIHAVLRSLPGSTLFLPARGVSIGSEQGERPVQICTTLARQRRLNPAFLPMKEPAFRRFLHADRTSWGPESEAKASRVPSVRILPMGKFLVRGGRPMAVVDVRDPAGYACAHLKGAVNLPLLPDLERWAGTLMDVRRTVSVVAEPGREEESVRRLARAGFRRIAGVLEGGMENLGCRADLLEATPRTTAHALSESLSERVPPFVVFVSAPGSETFAPFPSDLEVTLETLSERLGEIPRRRRIVVASPGGERSSAAVGFLRARGFRDVRESSGGTAAWHRLMSGEVGSPGRRACTVPYPSGRSVRAARGSAGGMVFASIDGGAGA